MLLLKLLEQVPFFWDFTPDERQIFAENDNFFATFQEGDIVIREGDTDDALFVLISGQFLVKKNNFPGKTLATLNPGAVIGEISFLTRRARSINIVAHGEEVVAFKIDGHTITKEKLEPSLEIKIKNKLVDILVQRLEDANLALAQQKGSNLALTKALRAEVLKK